MNENEQERSLVRITADLILTNLHGLSRADALAALERAKRLYEEKQ